MAELNRAQPTLTETDPSRGRKITLDVFRYLPDQEDKPRYQSYEVPFRSDWVVLDALNYIKDHIDGTLSYRWSCRMGVCGSCGMMVNGEPRLTCAAFLKEFYPNPIRVEPLAHFPVLRDLIINLEDFLHKLREVNGWLVPKEEKPVSEGEYLQTPMELAMYKQYSMCINCMLCYAACPVYGMDNSYIGPAAIALAQRYNLDSRDGAKEQRAQVIASSEGVWECTFVGECSAVCPKHVDPAGAIQQAKVQNTVDWYKAVLLPWGKR
ncbi:MAG: succinate dehydrogenase/fumarate reductase iron-sulfur subunit [Chloroflexota bacterium]